MDFVKTAAQLDKKRTRARGLYLLFGCGLAASLVLLFTERYQAGLLILALMLLFYFALARPAVRGFYRDWRQARLDRTLALYLPSARPLQASQEMGELLLKDGVLPIAADKAQATMLRRYFCWESAALMDVTFATKQTIGGKDRYRWLSGSLYRAPLRPDCTWNMRLVSAAMMSEADWIAFYRAQGLSACATGPGGADAPAGMRWILSDGSEQAHAHQAFKTLARLCAYTPGQVLFGIKDGVMTVFINRRVLSGGEPSLKTAVSPAALEEGSYPELELLLKATGQLLGAQRD